MRKIDIIAKQQIGCGLSALGGLLTGGASVFEVVYILSSLNFSLFQKISLPDSYKMFLSLCLFFGLSSMILGMVGAYILRKGYSKTNAIVSILAIIFALLALFTPAAFGLDQPSLFFVGTLFGMALFLGSAAVSLTIPSDQVIKRRMFTSVEVATVALFSALYAVMIVFTYQVYPIPSPTGGFLHFGDFVIFTAALLFGGKVGGMAGAVGAVVADFYLGYPRWYVSIIAHGLEGAIPGLAKKRHPVVQLAALVVGGFMMASTYFFVNIFIKGYPVAVLSYVQDLFAQAGISIIIGFIVSRVAKKALPQL